MQRKERNKEALNLSEEILTNIELSEIPYQNIILKCLRLARLINDTDAFEWLNYEANGYKLTKDGYLTSDSWKATEKSGRRYFKKNDGEDKPKEYAFTETIAVMESVIATSSKRMEVSYDPNISISSHSEYNPILPRGNSSERNSITTSIKKYTEKIEKVKAKVYEYVLGVNYELKFGNITEDIFTRKRNYVDRVLKDKCPKTIQKFISVYDNIKSINNEDWANAVHSCRRILKDVADVLLPPSNQPYIKEGTTKEIKIGEEQYINRLIIYIENKSESDSYTSIVGSHLKYIGERLDSIYSASNKGTHSEVTIEEAERYIIYTYLIIGDILLL